MLPSAIPVTEPNLWLRLLALTLAFTAITSHTATAQVPLIFHYPDPHPMVYMPYHIDIICDAHDKRSTIENCQAAIALNKWNEEYFAKHLHNPVNPVTEAYYNQLRDRLEKQNRAYAQLLTRLENEERDHSWKSP